MWTFYEIILLIIMKFTSSYVVYFTSTLYICVNGTYLAAMWSVCITVDIWEAEKCFGTSDFILNKLLFALWVCVMALQNRTC